MNLIHNNSNRNLTFFLVWQLIARLVLKNLSIAIITPIDKTHWGKKYEVNWFILQDIELLSRWKNLGKYT
jgi:hypothetical protein